MKREFFSAMGCCFGGQRWLQNLDLLKNLFFFFFSFSKGKPVMCSGELSDTY